MRDPEQMKAAFDYSLGGAAISSPLWLQYLEQGAAMITLFGGAILILGRLWQMFREWQGKRGGHGPR